MARHTRTLPPLRWPPRLASVACALLLSSAVAAAPPPRRTYTDRADAVTFTYPAAWLLNGDDDAATAKLRIVDLAPPHAVVQLEGNFADHGPYKGTDFEAGAFAYTVLPAPDQATCLARLDALAGPGHAATPLRWHNLPARRLDATGTVAGTDDLHRILLTYTGTRCLAFETVLIRKTTGPDITALPPTRWSALEGLFAGVLDSVHLKPY